MAEPPVLLQVQDVRLPKAVGAFNWAVRSGESWALMGKSGTGKTTLVEMLTGEPTTAKGRAILHGSVRLADTKFPRRSTPQSLATQASGRGRATDAGEALNLLDLWDVRRSSVDQLGTGHQAACALLRPLLDPPDVAILDLILDALDPWVLPRALKALRAWLSPGRAAVVVTQRPDVASAFSHALILGGSSILYRGEMEKLLSRTETLTVETRDVPAVRQLVEPFGVIAEENAQGLTLRAADGQALAARLLLEGYGEIRSIHTRPKSLAETLVELEENGALWYPPGS